MTDLQFAWLLCCFASTTLALGVVAYALHRVERLVKRLNASEVWDRAVKELVSPVGGRYEN